MDKIKDILDKAIGRSLISCVISGKKNKLDSIDKIKIDKSFLEDTEKSKKILESIFYLADALSLTTIVEGVELQSQEIFLRNFSCDIVQGFLYSKPLSLGEIQKMLDS